MQEGPPEQDPDFYALQQRSSSNAELLANLPLPVAAFVAALNGLTGAISLAGGTTTGITVNITPGAGTITISLAGIGTMAAKNVAAAVTNVSTADATDLATAIALANANKAKINELLGALRTAVHITP